MEPERGGTPAGGAQGGERDGLRSPRWSWRARLRMPPPTVRLRLTALYGGMFLITGAVLLTIGYLLVRSNLGGHHYFRNRLRALGLLPHLSSAFNAQDFRLARAVQQQLTRDALHRLVIEYFGALMAMTVISVGAGWILAGRALRPLREIIATARRVSGENLGERIALSGPADELRELADTFDGMLARLDTAFASQRSFVANASHELRTPLAIMRTEIDVALGDPDGGESDLRAMAEAVRETVDRCEGLIAGLLVLARSQAAAVQSEPVDLAALAADCITDLRARSDDAALEVRDDLQTAPTIGDPSLLERVVANLIDNGIRHNRPGGFLAVSTREEAGVAVLEVRNSGPDVAPADAASLAEPFRRLDRSVSGFGLGLSIVRSVVGAHGGTLTIRARPEGGLAVGVTLPARGDRAGLGGQRKAGAGAPRSPRENSQRLRSPLTES